MRKLFSVIAFTLIATTLFTACLGDDDSTLELQEWKDAIEAYFLKHLYGDEYEKVVAEWDTTQYVLMKYNTRNPEGKQPIFTSTIDMIYKGAYHNEAAFDSSYLQVDSIYNVRVNQLVTGFQIALQYMHEGEDVHLIIPWQLGYGASPTNGIDPYSALVFDLKLKKVYRDYQP